MGNSASGVDNFSKMRSVLSNDPLHMEAVESIFSFTFTNNDLIRALPNEFIRDLRHFHTERFALMLYYCIKQISVIREKKNLSAPSFKGEDVSQFLTALQVLRRLLPIAFEDRSIKVEKYEQGRNGTAPPVSSPGKEVLQTAPPYSDSDEPNTLSHYQRHTSSPPPSPISSNPSTYSQEQNGIKTQSTFDFQRLFFMLGSRCSDKEVDSRFPLLPLQEAREAPVALGPYLAWVLVESCFIKGFTLSEEEKFEKTPLYSMQHPDVDMSLLWCPGIACTNPSEAPLKSAPNAVHTPRKELLETLLVLASSPLFNREGYRDIMFTESLISVSVVPLMPTLTVSMLNTILTYKPHNHFPYATNLSIDERDVVIQSSRLLSAILCYTGIPMVASPSVPCDGPPMEGYQCPTSQSSNNDRKSGGGDRRHPIMTKSLVGTEVTNKVRGSFLATSFTGEQDNTSEVDGLSGLVLHPPSSLSVSSNPMSPCKSPKRAPTIARNEPIATSSQSQYSCDGTSCNVSKSISQVCFVHSVRKTIHDLTMSEAKLILDRLKNTMVPSLNIGQRVLPGSQLVTIPQDGLMFLLSKLLDISPSMSNQFSLSPGVLFYLVRVVEYGMEAQKSIHYSRQSQISLNILLHLSQSRGFALLCNQTLSMSVSIPFPFPKLPTGSTYNDFLVVALSFFMGYGEAFLGPYIISCSAVLANMAPFIISLGKVASRCLVAAFAYLAHRCLSYTASNSSGQLVIYGMTMSATCEAISSLLRYHEEGSRYVIVFLLKHRSVIRRVREAYASSEFLKNNMKTPFMIQDLEAVVAAALPIVGSLGSFHECSANSDDDEYENDFNAFWNCHEGGFEDDKTVLRKLNSIVLVGMLLPHQIIIKGIQVTKQTEERNLELFWGSMFLCFAPGTLGDYKSIKLLRFL